MIGALAAIPSRRKRRPVALAPCGGDRLAGGETVVWVTRCVSEHVHRVGFTYLAADELERAMSYRSQGEREKFLAGRSLLRVALSNVVESIAPDEWRFEALPGGKLALAQGSPSFSISVSHAGALAAVAVSSGPSVGIDLEPLASAPLVPPIWGAGAGRYASDEPFLDNSEEAVTSWTLQEAMAKYTGSGLPLHPYQLRPLNSDLQAGECLGRTLRVWSGSVPYLMSVVTGGAGEDRLAWRAIDLAKLSPHANIRSGSAGSVAISIEPGERTYAVDLAPE